MEYFSKNMEDKMNEAGGLRKTEHPEKPRDYPEHTNVKSFLRYLLQRSSVNGVSRIGTEANWIHRCIWFAVLIFGVVGCSFQCHQFLKSYFSYPVVVNLVVQNKWVAKFPAVTICNLNRVNVNLMTQKCNEENFRHFWACMDFLKHDPLLESPKNESFKASHAAGVPQTGIKSYVRCEQLRKGLLSDERERALSFLSGYSQLPEDFRQEVGHQFDHLVKTCSFNGEPCSKENFTTQRPSPTLGNCFTFNGQNDQGSNSPIITKSVGVESGLILELDVQVDEYLPLTEDMGVRVSVHGFSETPIPAEDGLNVSPGFETFIGIKKTTVRRLPDPYKEKCCDYEKRVKAENTQESCFRSCFQNHTIRICNCSNTFLNTEDINITKICDLNNETDVCCMELAEETFKESSNDSLCDCPLPCKKHYYDTTLSFAAWPSPKFMKNMVDQRQTNNTFTSYDEVKQSYSRNRARVRVFYKTLERAIYKQIPMYQNSEVFSQMGGQLGLWLGVSLIALFECLESVVLLVHFAIRRKREP